MTWAVVIPSNRPDSLAAFTEAWAELFEKHEVRQIIVHDNEDTWAELPWWVPRRSDMIRSWGFAEAYRLDVDYVLTLDDDTRPIGDPFDAYEAVFEAGAPHSEYLSVGALTSSQLQMRGFPFEDRKPATVAVQYGGWCGVLDYDAPTQLAAPRRDETFHPIVMPVPHGTPATCCIMNCAFRREVTPIMWQLPLLEGRYNRWGDIWSGLLQKKALDAAGQVMVINGKASVRHERASDPFTNLAREQPGLRTNETLWGAIRCDVAPLTEAWKQATWSFANYFYDFDDPQYAAYFLRARNAWLTHLEVA
jgi:hypothetical protein